MYLFTASACEALPASEQEWSFYPVDGGLCINGYSGDPEVLTVPPAIGGLPVLRLCLDCAALTGDCRTLVIPEGIEEVSLDLSAARGLKRLVFPSSAHLIASPIGLDKTPWFRSHGPKAVYLGGYYCGTPGGGCGTGTELVIRPGTAAVAYGADFHCFWRSIVMPDSVKTIGQLAFGDARCLEKLRLPAFVERIGDFAFQFCPRLGELWLPDSICHATAPFMLCTGLREVSMAEGCPIKTKFSFCSRLVYRSGGKCRVETRGIIPTPILGQLYACPARGPILAAGRSYPDMGSVTALRRENGLCTDCFGNSVQEITEEPPCDSGSGEAAVRRWYMHGPNGLTEISYDALCRVYMVWDGIPENALPPELRARLSGTPLGSALP